MTKRAHAAKAATGRKVAAAPAGRKKDFSHIANPELRTALEKAGGYTELAKALQVSRQMAYRWEAIPERLAVRCEELYGIPREKIAPELFKGIARA